MDMLWTNSGDSHYLEPPDLFTKNLPPEIADRLPRTERDGDDEIVYIDGKTIRRKVPKPSEMTAKALKEFRDAMFQEGESNLTVRKRHLDEQGVWAEVVYPSRGLWYTEIEDPELVAAGCRVINDYVADSMFSEPRLVPTALLPLQSIEHTVVEAKRVAELGFKAVFIPTDPPRSTGLRWNSDIWEPLWALCEEAGLVPSVHIGSDAAGTRPYRNPGGAMLNYLETTYGGQKAAAQLTASGALERHPNLKVLISEGGAAWVPFVGDRLNEAFRQHHMFDENRLSRPPKDYLMNQVYASFQHDETAIPTLTAMGYRNIMFGTDYPHLEGTYPNTQEVLHGLLDGVDDATSDRIRCGAFLDLFPHVGRPATVAA